MDLQNPNLRTYAVAEAQDTKGFSKPSEYFIPFFQAVIGKLDGEPFKLETVLDGIYKEYSLEIPLYFADSLTHILEEKGSILKSSISGVNVRVCKKVDGDYSGIKLDKEHFDLLEEKIKLFASSYGVEEPLYSSSWIKALIAFFSEAEPPSKVAILKGKMISNPKEKDDWLVSKFITYFKSFDKNVFEVIKIIYSAYALADTFRTIQEYGHLDDWKDLSVIYDSTVLMRILGTSGDVLKKATLEMHHMLQEAGCKTYYFSHNYSELLQNLEAIVERKKSGAALHRETAQALEQGEISISELRMLPVDCDRRLGELNITQLEMPNRMENIQAQINPVGLEDFLKSKINYRKNTLAAEIDAQSIENILFLRSGKKYTELPKCKYIFATHNHPYSKYSYVYCKDECGYTSHHVSPIVTLGTLTRLAWLASENELENWSISSDLIISCYQASMPDDRWFDRFWKIIEESRPELLRMDAHESLYLLDVRKSAEELSLGNSTLLEELDISEIVGQVEAKVIEKETKHREELDETRKKVDRAITLHEEEKARIIQDGELQKQNIERDKQAEVLRLKQEYELTSKLEREKVREEERQKFIEKEKDNARLRLEAIEHKSRNMASSKALEYTRIITLIVALVFGYVFYLFHYGGPSISTNLMVDNIVKWTAIFLSILQVIGLFLPGFSLLFFGKYFNRWIEERLFIRYKEMLQE